MLSARRIALITACTLASAARAQQPWQGPTPDPKDQGPQSAGVMTPPPVALEAIPPERQADQEAALRFESAVRAGTQGKLLEARRLTEEGLTLAPGGRYQPLLQRLLIRLDSEVPTGRPSATLGFAPRPSPVAARATFNPSAALQGLAAGLFFGSAATANSDNTGPGLAGAGLIGLAVGLVGSILVGPFGEEPSVSAHLWTGGLFGLGTAAALSSLSNASGQTPAIAIGIGLVAGGIGGALLGQYTDLTDGDGVAGTTLMVHGALIPTLILAAVESSNGSVDGHAAVGLALGAGVVGTVAGEWANHGARWSSARWGVINLGGVLGAAAGILIAVAANGDGTADLGALAAGDVVGLVATTLLTQGFEPGAPRGVVTPAAPAAASAAPPASAVGQPPGIASGSGRLGRPVTASFQLVSF